MMSGAVRPKLAKESKSRNRRPHVLNAIGFRAVQGGRPAIDLRREDFVSPIASWTTTQFLTARAAARHRPQKRSGVILVLVFARPAGAVGLLIG
jgi:hypothetical protein